MEDDRVFKRIKKSSYISVGLVIYCIVNEIAAYLFQDIIRVMILDASIGIMVILFFIKDEHYQEWAKLLELNMLIINLIPIVLLNLI